jgi:hypothetical protein
MTSGLESREYCRRDPSRWPHDTLYPQEVALISPTSGGRSVSIVRSRTQATEYSSLCHDDISPWIEYHQAFRELDLPSTHCSVKVSDKLHVSAALLPGTNSLYALTRRCFGFQSLLDTDEYIELPCPFREPNPGRRCICWAI